MSSPGTPSLKIATWNVNGIRARQAQFADWVAVEKPDVVCLQEIKASSAQVPAALCEMEGFWCYWHGAGGYSGVGLHVSKASFSERPEFVHPEFDHETRIVTARLVSTSAPGGSHAVTVASIYVPNGGKDFPAKMRFLESLEQFAARARGAGETIVLCGDLNVARAEIDVHPKERKPIIGQLPEERALFEKILSHGLVDVGRTLDPANEGLFTWWAPWRNMRQRNIGWRLDYVLASEGLAASARSCEVRKDVGTSDHAPVVAEFGRAS